ncbi:MAG: PEP-CTERM sorting domain-containing protein [Planctomycetota bacterium]
MKLTKMVGVALVAVVMALPMTAAASTYLPYGASWRDANKDWLGDDDLLCWAGAASNILSWGNWGTAAFPDEHVIFDDFEAHWTDQGSWPSVAWQWWLNGTHPETYPYGPEWATVNVPGGGGHWPELNFSGYFSECWDDNLAMSAIDSYLHAGYGVTLGIYDGGHAITVWGYEYDTNDPNYYEGIYITDTDDGAYQLAYYPVSWDIANTWWDIGGGYGGWHIQAVQALLPVPEPSTLLVLGSGLVGIIVFGRKRRSERRKEL